MRVQLVTTDGVRLNALHLPRRHDLGIVLAHGFTGSLRRPEVRRVAEALSEHAGVVCFDFRGHGRSGGRSTLGDREINDVDAAVTYARGLGYRTVATVGFSMGASIVLRHAALVGGTAAVVAVSGPGRWYFRKTASMRRAHWLVERRAGRAAARVWLRTRISNVPWDPIPIPPTEAAARIAPTPLLVVHGDRDGYFPVDHAEDIYAAAQEPKELWIVPGFGHAEAAASRELVGRIGAWVSRTVSRISPA